MFGTGGSGPKTTSVLPLTMAELCSLRACGRGCSALTATSVNGGLYASVQWPWSIQLGPQVLFSTRSLDTSTHEACSLLSMDSTLMAVRHGAESSASAPWISPTT